MSKAHSIIGVSKGRGEHDYYKTPPEATRAILREETFDGSIWEPACGDGAISKILEEFGYETIISSDLVDRGFGVGGVDFLANVVTVDNIITNPPYSLAQEFVEHSLKCAKKKIILLCKIQFLAGMKRKKLFETTPFKGIYVCSRRLKMDRAHETPSPNSGMMDFAWFVWDYDYQYSPTIQWI